MSPKRTGRIKKTYSVPTCLPNLLRNWSSMQYPIQIEAYKKHFFFSVSINFNV